MYQAHTVNLMSFQQLNFRYVVMVGVVEAGWGTSNSGRKYTVTVVQWPDVTPAK